MIMDAKQLEKLLIAMLLSTPNYSMKIIGVNLQADLKRFELNISEILPTGDYIISIREK